MKHRVLIEASKLYMPGQDGVKRYLEQLVRHLFLLNNTDFEIDLLLGKGIVSLQDFFIINNDDNIFKNPLLKEREKYFFRMGVTMSLLSVAMRVIGERQALLGFYESRYYPVMLTQLTRLGRGRYPALRQRLESYDLIHVALPQNLLFFQKTQARFVVTVHDISHRLFPAFHTKDNIRRSEEGISLMRKKRAACIAVSSASANDFAREYDLEGDRYTVIHEAADSRFCVKNKIEIQKIRQKYELGESPYFLCLATLEPRKNMMNAIRAFEEAMKEYPKDVSLVVAGGKGWKNRDIKRELRISSDAVRFIGFVDDDDLPVLYSGALAFLYPSYYEGFGLPLVEAMACGTPVLYGNNSSMPEVVGDAGIPLAPDDVESMKNALLRLLSDSPSRQGFSKAALARSARFSWEHAAEETLHFYQKIIQLDK